MRCKPKREYLPIPSDDPDVMLVPLTRGLFTKIDTADYDIVAPYMWCALPDGWNVYATRARQRDGSSTKMHRVLMGTPKGMHTDHINGDGLDNRRANLRICTSAENMRNRRSNTGSSSRFLGVHFDRKSRVWRAQIRSGSASQMLGSFADEVEAALAYDAAARVSYGEFARLNFGGGA